MIDKQLVPLGIAGKIYDNAWAASMDTYAIPTADGRGKCITTPLVFDANPYNDEIKTAKIIFEIGGGIGRNIPWIMENTVAEYVTVEPNPSMQEFFWELQDHKWKDRVSIFTDFDELNASKYKNLNFDVVLSIFVFQHIGYRATANQFNITDITKATRMHCTPETVWLMIEHDSEEPGWIDRWMTENDILPQLFVRNFRGIPELTTRGDHHLIIWREQR
jgi:hypothetical protein